MQLHFSKPAVYDEIYNSQNKWDKDYELYRGFDADESFFTQTLYMDAKHRRSLISNMFSRKAISEIQHLVRHEVRSIIRFVYLGCLIHFVDGSIRWHT